MNTFLDKYNKTIEFNKLLDKYEHYIPLIDKIISNIINYPSIEKYRYIKMRKLNNDVIYILHYLKFKSKVRQFEEHLVYEDDDYDYLKFILELINRRRQIIENKKTYQLNEANAHKVRMDEHKKLADQCKLDQYERFLNKKQKFI